MEGPAMLEATRHGLTLQEISRLDQKLFEHSLPQLCQAVDQPGQIAAADRGICGAITTKLRNTDETTPHYWPTVLRFLQAATSRIAQKAPPRGQRPRALSDILFVGIMRGIREDGRTILFDGGSFGNSAFKDCRIIITQNPVQMQRVVFRNCAFEFPPGDTPSLFVKEFARLLLSSDLGSVFIANL